MTINEREGAALLKLLKISRLKADETGRRIANLEAAWVKTDASLKLLADAVSNEEAAARAAEVVGFAQLAGFLTGAARKKATLEATKTQIAAEIESARGDLEDLFIETKKLEHLVDRARLAAQRRDRRVEAASMSDAAIARFVRKNER
ncbi:MAG: hypothetical protein A3E78_15955 [Alphaproteobacteria bacterium RIFCSPHIGHO2_12_FULL_63_12]|nr:MAG: hypothetical protein A3E78_15955 [Alphaproteobacteria bacterium RIFCSPHIGHO2_12_FULL_63_12]